MDLQGKVIEICPAKTGTSQTTGQPWKMQDFVVELEAKSSYEAQNPTRVAFTVRGDDRWERFNIRKDSVVKVHFGIRASRTFEGRWFNNVEAWDVREVENKQ